MRVHVRFHHTTRALPSRHGTCPALPCPALPCPPPPTIALPSPASCCSPCSPNPIPRLSPQTFCAVPLKLSSRPICAQQVQLSPKPVLKLTVSSPSMGAELSYPPHTFTCFDANAEVSPHSVEPSPAPRHPGTGFPPLLPSGRLHVPLLSRRARSTRAPTAGSNVHPGRESHCFGPTLAPRAETAGYGLLCLSAAPLCMHSGAAPKPPGRMWLMTPRPNLTPAH